MALKNPTVAYIAANNIEAYVVREMLQGADIEAAVIEDESRAAVWLLGLLPGIHRPKVYVDETDVARAQQLIAEYERRNLERESMDGDQQEVEVVCEECGETSKFPAAKLGAVETCPHCAAYVDVGDPPDFDEWNANPSSS